MEVPEIAERDNKNVCENEENEDKLLEKLDSNIEKMMVDNNEGLTITHKEAMNIELKNYAVTANNSRILSEYVSGEWQFFFRTWDDSFSDNIKESMEYKILTLKLRVHFAILPIRIVQLQQNFDHGSNTPDLVIEILENVADKFSSVDEEKDIEDEKTKLTINSMKQLEDFLNSCDGQNITVNLKDNFYKTFFALPYIVNPHEDESMKQIFSIEWLKELTDELKIFTFKYLKENTLLQEENIARAENVLPMNSEVIFNSGEKINTKTISCDKKLRSARKNKDIEDWITHQRNIVDDSSHIKSTQTHISSIKTGTGFSLVSEPHYVASIVTPSVFSIPTKQSVLYNDELSRTKTRLFSMHKHYRKLKLRFHKLHEDYQKMNEIAEILTIALENSVRGEPVSLEMILQSCLKIFPNRFSREIQTDSEDTSTDFKDLSTNNDILKEKHDVLCNKPLPSSLLDFKKIKFHLKSRDSRTKLLLLQALRQKLTLSQPEHRIEVIQEYTTKNVLELQENVLDSNKSSILPYIFHPIKSNIQTNLVQQTTARFLNTLASFSCGRSYLSAGPIILNSIIKYLDNCNGGAGDTISLDMLLATLQKMSLRKSQRNYMVEANLVEWLIYHLKNEHLKMGSYRLEYACALLMNLSLQHEARSRVSVIAPLFISTIISLLSSDCISILPYVNGALQNFLLNNEINEEAKKSHLTEVLEYHKSESGEELRNLFVHTLKIHKRECDNSLSDNDDFADEDDEIFDVLEKELEEDDPIKVEIGELHGEKLLTAHYSTSGYERSAYPKILDVRNIRTSTRLISESKNTSELHASTIIATSETDDSKTESPQQLVEMKSSTKIANVPKQQEIEEKIFQAKPKLMRTPPPSARNSAEKIFELV